MKKTLGNGAGWIGVILIHSATLPAIYQAMVSGLGNNFPILMTLMIFTGLILFLVNAVYIKNRLYIISNSVGAIGNGAVLALYYLSN